MKSKTPLQILKSKTGRRLTVEIPAATSNLGAGLDTFGLALALYCRLTFVLLKKNDSDIPFVTFSGPIVKESLPAETGKLVYKMLSKLWSQDNAQLERVRIHVDSEIPLGCGLGGGTAAVLGALWADQIFKDVVPSTEDLLAQATKWEGHGHSETFAASLIGDFVVTAKCADSEQIITRRHHWPERWEILAVVPNYRLNTASSKALIPTRIPYPDAMFNLQRAALMVSAVVTADERALKEALKDRWHEQYRAALVPELLDLQTYLQEEQVHGCVLSGGGSSIIVIVDEDLVPYIMRRLERWSEKQLNQPKIMQLEVDRKGLSTLQVV